jgi:seryl-tRNA synthetase
MLDPKRLRADTESVRALLARRGYAFDLGRFQELEGKRKTLQVDTEKLQAERNARSKEIGQAKAKGQDVGALMRETEALKGKLDATSAALDALQAEFDRFLLDIPNLPHASVPDGADAGANVELRRWGAPRPGAGLKDHADLGEALGQMDFAAAAKLTGARFVVLRRGLAQLHRALTQFMLDLHTREHGYEELYVPYMVNAQSLRGTGQLPKFGADLFHLQGEQDW